MKNTFGQSIAVTLFGESHGPEIGIVIDGLAPGIAIDIEQIALDLSRRRPSTKMDTSRREQDNFRIVSGMFEGKTTGTPLTILIPNEDKVSASYEKYRGIARPSHADYSAYAKYHGFEDYRGGGHFSGRITAPIVAAGSICKAMLKQLGIQLATHISSVGEAEDRAFDNILKDIATLEKTTFPVLSPDFGAEVEQKIEELKARKDSLGATTETVIYGMPAGVGEPWFDSVEGVLSHALFSLGGVKGVAFGAGFDFSGMCGSVANDTFCVENGKIINSTNHSGGINGGITNGMPILFRCAVKPTPSIAPKQQTVNFHTGENTEIAIEGRHDPVIFRRICPVIDAISAIVLCDMLALRYGTDVFTRGLPQ